MLEILWKYGAPIVAIAIALGVLGIILNVGGIRAWISRK